MILEISSNEKYLLLMALAKLDYETFHAFKWEPAAERYQLINRVAQLGTNHTSPPPSPGGEPVAERTPATLPHSNPNSGTQMARDLLAPPQKKILWAEGKPKSDAKQFVLTILGVARKDSGGKPRLLLKPFQGAYSDENTKIPATISLWDKALFDSVASKVNQPWTYYLTYSADGKYCNLAGMDAPQ